MSKKIVINVDAKGNTDIEAFGFPDGTCLRETKSIEEALGKVTSRDKKPEAYKIDAGQGGIKVGE